MTDQPQDVPAPMVESNVTVEPTTGLEVYLSEQNKRLRAQVASLAEELAIERHDGELQAATVRSLSAEVERRDRAIEAARVLSAKLVLCAAAEVGVYQMAAIHGMHYIGPTYSEEKKNLDAALAALDGGGE